MSENTSRFDNESEQMPLDASEASDFLAHSITSRLQRMTLSPWVQRALQSDADTGDQGGGGLLSRVGMRRTAITTEQTFTLLNRMDQVNDRSIVWHADVGSIEPAIESFTDKIVGRFATTESKYMVQQSEEDDQAKQNQGPEMVFADFGGGSGSSTTGSTTGTPSTRRSTFDVNSLPEIPEHIKAQHMANRTASPSPSSGPISLTPSPKGASTPSKAPVPQRPLTPEERRKMRLYSRVEYVTPGGAAPDVPPVAAPSLNESPTADLTLKETAASTAETPAATSPMPELPPGVTPVSEPVEEPKWRTRPRARVDYLTPRGDTPKSAEESAPDAATVEQPTAVQAAPDDEDGSQLAAEAVQRQVEAQDELPLHPRSRHRETPEGEGKQGELAADSALPTSATPDTPAPVQREEQPAPTPTPNEDAVPQAAQSGKAPAAQPQVEQRPQPTPEPSDASPLSQVVAQRESLPTEALDLPLHPRQRQRPAQEESATEPAAPSVAAEGDEISAPRAATPDVQRQPAERPATPEAKARPAAESDERPRVAAQPAAPQEEPTQPVAVQRRAEGEQPLDMPLRPRARPTSSENADAQEAEAASSILSAETAHAPATQEPADSPSKRAETSDSPRPPAESRRTETPAAQEATRPTPPPSEKSASPRPVQRIASEVAEPTPLAQPVQRQAAADEEIELPLRPRTRPRKVQAEAASDTPALPMVPNQADEATEPTRSATPQPRQPAVDSEPKVAAAESTTGATPLGERQPSQAPTPTPVQRQAVEGKLPSATPVQRQIDEEKLPTATPIQRQTVSPEAFELPLRPRGRRVASQPAPEAVVGEEASPVSEQPSVTPGVRPTETVSPATPATPVVQRLAEPLVPTPPTPTEVSAQAHAPAPIAQPQRETAPVLPVSVERQTQTFEVPELPLRVRPRPRMVAEEDATVEPVAETNTMEAGEVPQAPTPTPARAQARKASPAPQKAAQRKVAQAPQSSSPATKAPVIQRQPTRAQAMPLRPRRRVVATSPQEIELNAPPIVQGPTVPPTIRQAELPTTEQTPTTQPVRVQRRAKSAKPALPLRARAPRPVIAETMDSLDEYVTPLREVSQPVMAQPTVAQPTVAQASEVPAVPHTVEAPVMSEATERPTVPLSPILSEAVQRAERAVRPSEPVPALPLRALRRRQPEGEGMEESAAPLDELLVARLTAPTSLPLSGPKPPARAQRVAQRSEKGAPKPALPKATRVQREPARQPNKVVAQRARPAPKTHEEATTQLAMAGWRFKRNAGTTVSDPGMISRSLDNLVQRSDTGRPLDTGTRTKMESALGRDFSQVRVHNVQLSPLNVQAASEGRNVYFDQGQSNFDNPESLSLLGHELTHVAQAGFAQTKSVVQTAILPQARVQRSEAADEAEADQGERTVMEYLRRPQMAQMMPLVNEAAPAVSSAPAESGPSSGGAATVQRMPESDGYSDMPVVQRAETGGDSGAAEESASPTGASGSGEDSKSDKKDPAEKAKELTKLARQLYPLIKRMLMVERERHSGI